MSTQAPGNMPVMDMLLENKNAIVYGGAGSVGGAVARAVADMQQATMLKRLPTLADVGNVAAFMASDQAGAMTATVANITCGQVVD